MFNLYNRDNKSIVSDFYIGKLDNLWEMFTLY